MGRSQETYNKKEVRNKQEKKRKDKAAKRLERKEKTKGSSLDDMIAYVDENGNITSTPPDPTKKKKTKLEDIEIGVPKKSEEDQEDTALRGKVVFMNDEKGYGFIQDYDSQEKIFVHVNNTLDDIKQGDVVTYTLGKGPKGMIAMQVKIEKK